MTIVNGNLLPDNDSSFETSVAGWAAASNTTIAQSTAHAFDGTHSMSLTSTAAGNVSSVYQSHITVTAGQLYTLQAWVYSTIARPANIEIDWYNGATYQGFINLTNPVTLTANAWTSVQVSGLCIAGANQAVPIVIVQAGAASQVFYADLVFFGSEPLLPPDLPMPPPMMRAAVR